MVIVGKPLDAGLAELRALSDGRLKFIVMDDVQRTIASFTSQRIDVSGQGFAAMFVTWSPDKISLLLHRMQAGVQLTEEEFLSGALLADAPGISSRSIFLPETPTSTNLSTDRVDASQACERWILNRRAKFSSPRLSRARLKTIHEQVDDLRRSVLCLKDISEQVVKGKNHLLGILATELRALVYWKKDAAREHNHNPLLLRLASKADLPLPVYVGQSCPWPESLPHASVYFSPNSPRLRSIFQCDHLVDLQDWLDTVVMRIDGMPNKPLTAKDVISETAYTLGSAHYDEDVSEFIAILRDMKSFEVDQLVQFLISTAGIVGDLSEWVISELRSRPVSYQSGL
jgi:hypothetical protein